jgi:hypothetical protein
MQIMKSVTGIGVLGMSLLVAACGPKNPPPPPPTPAADAGVASADAGAEPNDWLLLVDWDAIVPTPPPPNPEALAKLAGSTIKTWRKTKAECKGKDDALLVVDGGYEGAFTTPGAKENLYLVNVTPCDAKVAPTHNLLVVKDGKALVNQAIPEDDIVSVKDLDLDGDLEILVITMDPPKARLVDTEDAKYEQLYDFGTLAKGSCEGGKPSGESADIKYRKTATGVTYKAETKPKTCPK